MKAKARTKQSKTKLVSKKKYAIDFTSPSLWENDPPGSDKQHLRMWRETLEEVIAPCVTLEETDEILEFKGKRSYLKARTLTPHGTEQAVIALQCLYQLEAARKAGDIDKAITMVLTFEYHKYELQQIWQWGLGEHEARRALWRGHTQRRLSREGKTKLGGVPDLILQVAYAKHAGKKDWLQCVTKDVVQHCGGKSVSDKKVSQELKMRGISE